MTKVENNINYTGIKSIIEEMSKEYTVQVGMLADGGGSDNIVDRDGKEHNDTDYAGLGAKMEYGSPAERIPARSWLQMPLEKRNKEIIKETKMGYSGKELKYAIENKIIDLQSLAIILGAKTVEQIQEAFDTKGFGEWEENAPLTIKLKGSAMPLIDTGAFRSRVRAKIVGSESSIIT